MTTDPTPSLHRDSLRVLDSLPTHIRLLHLRRDFPHVLNQLAACWGQPRQFDRQMQSLLTDERGNRHGFPYPVMMELVDLRTHYLAQLQPLNRTAVTRGTRTA